MTRKSWVLTYGGHGVPGVPLPGLCTPENALPQVFLGLRKRFDGLEFSGDQATISDRPNLVFYAKLYEFATKYLIEPLRVQCLQTLHQCLVCCDSFGVTVPRILDLIEYIYQENCTRVPVGKHCSLRELVIHFAACELRSLNEDPRFREMLDTNAEMGSDLVMMLLS